MTRRRFQIDLRPTARRMVIHKRIIRPDLEVAALCSRHRTPRVTDDWAQVSCGKCLTQRGHLRGKPR